MKVKDKNKNLFEKVRAILEWVLIGIALCIVIFTIISVTVFDRNDRTLFGYRIYVCVSNSMKATDFAYGDLVMVKTVDPADLEEGDIIAYVSENAESQGKTITHKIRSIKKTGTEPAFVTYGTTTGMNDELPVNSSQVLGKYQFHIPVVGEFFLFLKTTLGYMLCVFLPFVLLFAVRLYHSIKLQKEYIKARKNEKLKEIKEETIKEGGKESEDEKKSID